MTSCLVRTRDKRTQCVTHQQEGSRMGTSRDRIGLCGCRTGRGRGHLMGTGFLFGVTECCVSRGDGHTTLRTYLKREPHEEG